MSSPESAAAEMTAAAAGAATAVAAGVRWSERSGRGGAGDQRIIALTFPVGAEDSSAKAALRALAGFTGDEFVLEVRATSEEVLHLVHVEVVRFEAVKVQLEAAVPGLRAEGHNARTGAGGSAARRTITVPRVVVLQSDDAVAASRAVLTAVSALAPGEHVALRWALRPGRPGGTRSVAQILWHGYKNVPEPPAAWLRKTDSAGFSVEGQIVAGAGSAAKAEILADAVASTLRSRGTSIGSIVVRRSCGLAGPTAASRSGWLSVGEILPLIGWPLGAYAPENVSLGAARRLRAGKDVPTTGRILFTGHGASGPRPVALNRDAMLRHTALLGTTGSGKSTVMVSGVLSDMARGFGGAIIDPKADLVADVLDRLDPKDVDRVALIDPASDIGLVGLDLLGGGDPDLRSDVILGALKRVFEGSWGPRSDSYLRSGLRLLAEDPGASLSDWPRLYSDAAYRRRLVARLKDPIQRAEWAAYEALSPAEQMNHIAAPMGKVQAIIGRPRLRAVLAQPKPKLNVARHLESGGWIFVSVAPGPIGEAAAHFVAALAMYCIWNAVEARSAIPREKRRPLGIYVDELSSLSAVPIGVESLFERARGLGGSLTVAAQSLARVPEQTRSSLLGNAGTLITFRSGADEAARLARELPGLTQQDLQSLGKFEVAARVSLGPGGAARVLTGKTEPMADPTGAGPLARQRSAERFGRSLDEIDAMIAERYAPPEVASEEGKAGRSRRSS